MHSKRLIKTYIIALAILAILTSNMYVPALPILQQALHASAHITQMTVSYYMLGLAIGIIFYGPLSDAYGRKKTIIIGLIIYSIGSVVSALTHSINVFIIARIIQAFGAAAALSLWQALSIDFFKKDALKMIAAGYIAIGFIPAVSPLIGSYIIVYLGWRSVFVLLTIYSALLLLMTVSLLKNQVANSSANLAKQIAQDYKILMTDRAFILLVTFSSLLYSMLYVFIAETPHILNKLHYSTKSIGLFYIPVSIAFILGGIIAKNTFKNKPKNLAILGMLFYITGSLLQLVISLTGIGNTWYMLITPFTIITVGTGILLPLTVSRAMKRHPNIAGSSASLTGFMQNAMAFILSSIGATLSTYGELGLTISLLAIIAIALLISTYLIQKKYLID